MQKSNQLQKNKVQGKYSNSSYVQEQQESPPAEPAYGSFGSGHEDHFAAPGSLRSTATLTPNEMQLVYDVNKN